VFFDFAAAPDYQQAAETVAAHPLKLPCESVAATGQASDKVDD
jgi:hypothetical protein